MLEKFVESIVPNVSPLEGNTLEDDERVSFGVVADTLLGGHVQAADWTDFIIEQCRFDSTTVQDSG